MDLFNIFKKNSSPSATDIEILKKRKEIVKQLKLAQTKRTIVGITAPALGQGMFLVGVEEVHQDDQVVDLCPYDVTGNLLEVNSLEISGIKNVCAFNSPYRNPVLLDRLSEKTISR
jgi:hypothetical protein